MVGEDLAEGKHTVLVRASVEESAGLFAQFPGDTDRKQSKC